MPCITFPPAGRLGQTSPPSQSVRFRTDHRYYVPLRLPPVRIGVVRFSLSFPDTLFCPSFVVCVSAFADSSLRRGFLSDAGISPSGRTSSSYLSSLRRETDGSLKFPDYPFKRMPWSKTPVVSLMLAISHPGLLPSGNCKPSAFPSGCPEVYPIRPQLYPFRGSIQSLRSCRPQKTTMIQLRKIVSDNSGLVFF